MAVTPRDRTEGASDSVESAWPQSAAAPSPFPPIADYAFLSHCHTGELQAARDLMERLLGVASPLGLYAEEFDAATGRHLGNFPQAFSHLPLLEAAARIILAERLAEYV
jgi:GH15 family glucan-1,4-alpha-glucosidase